MAFSIRRDFVAEHLPFYLIAASYVLVLLSYPMPPSPGVVEALMGAGLGAACIALLTKARRLAQNDYRWLVACLVAGALLVIFPGIHGISRGIPFSNVARDLFPMMFLAVLVPLTVYSAGSARKTGAGGILLASILCVGAISSIEFIVDMKNEFGSMTRLSKAFDKTYGEPTIRSAEVAAAASQADGVNTFSVQALHIFEPAVTFAAIYCGCMFVLMLSQKRVPTAILCLVVAAIALYGLIMLRLRAPVGLFVIAQMYFLFHLASQMESRTRLKVAAATLMTGAVIAVVFRDMLWGLWLKHHLVGSNGKLAEWDAVVGILGSSWENLFVGIGWGGEFVPNYQPQPVRFTHSLISFVLLKAGILGLILLALIYGKLIGRLVGQIRRHPLGYGQIAVLLAGAAVITIGLTFQPTYKMLGFSVILSVLFAVMTRPNDGQGRSRQI